MSRHQKRTAGVDVTSTSTLELRDGKLFRVVKIEESTPPAQQTWGKRSMLKKRAKRRKR